PLRSFYFRLVRTIIPNPIHSLFSLFLFNSTPTTEIYTLSLHDALPISSRSERISDDIEVGFCVRVNPDLPVGRFHVGVDLVEGGDRKSTRLNSSHVAISYAVFCLKKKIKPCQILSQKR